MKKRQDFVLTKTQTAARKRPLPTIVTPRRRRITDLKLSPEQIRRLEMAEDRELYFDRLMRETPGGLR